MVSLSKIVYGIALIGSALAANNAFLTPGWGNVVNADSSYTITWTPSSSGNVNLILLQGGSQNLTTLYTIASNIPNSGSYTWAVPATAKTNTDYSIMIQDSSNHGETNYSPYFTILGVGQGITSSTLSTMTATAPNPSQSASSAYASASSGASPSSAATSGASSAAAASGTSSASGSASSSGTATASSSGSASTTTAAASSTASSGGASIRPAYAVAALAGVALVAVDLF